MKQIILTSGSPALVHLPRCSFCQNKYSMEIWELCFIFIERLLQNWAQGFSKHCVLTISVELHSHWKCLYYVKKGGALEKQSVTVWIIWMYHYLNIQFKYTKRPNCSTGSDDLQSRVPWTWMSWTFRSFRNDPKVLGWGLLSSFSSVSKISILNAIHRKYLQKKWIT